MTDLKWNVDSLKVAEYVINTGKSVENKTTWFSASGDEVIYIYTRSIEPNTLTF